MKQQFLRKVNVRTDVELTQQQIADSARALDAAMAGIEEIQQDVSERQKDAKAAIQRLTGKMRELRREISTGRGEREVLADEVAFYEENVVRTIEPYTMRKLGERPIRDEERQPTLPGIDPTLDTGPVADDVAPPAPVLAVEGDDATSAFEAGRASALAGNTENSNPHPLGTALRVEWMRGYYSTEEPEDDEKVVEEAPPDSEDGGSLNEAFEEGIAAYESGDSDIECPYEAGTLKATHWTDGWEFAELNKSKRIEEEGSSS